MGQSIGTVPFVVLHAKPWLTEKHKSNLAGLF